MLKKYGPICDIANFSKDDHYCTRKVIRETWLKSSGFPYRFLLDNETPQLLEEQKLYGDLFFMNATYSGYAQGFCEKLFLWFQYAYQTFSDVKLIAKIDDDVFVCVDKVTEYLTKIYDPRLYFGYMHNIHLHNMGSTCSDQWYIDDWIRIDEHFVALGRLSGKIPIGLF